MLTLQEATDAVTKRAVLRTEDGAVGRANALDTRSASQTGTAIHLVAKNLTRWVDIIDLTPECTLACCGRCSDIVDADTIMVTGPYTTCPPCAAIIRS